MEVKIIGSGAWGRALYTVIQENCPSVSLLKRGEKASEQDVVVLAVPTQSLREASQNISFTGPGGIVVNVAKGIEKNTHLLPNRIIRETLGPDAEYYSLIGPSFAEEVVRKMPTLVNLGYEKETENCARVKQLFQTDNFRVRLTKSLDALELSGAFKNIYAIACGIANGLGYETNTRVKLMVLAIEEMNTLYRSLRMSIDSDMTAGTLGDLILTCNSMESRNFRFGSLIAKYPINEAIRQISSTIEGYDSLASVDHYRKITNLKLPLASFVADSIARNNPFEMQERFKKFVLST